VVSFWAPGRRDIDGPDDLSVDFRDELGRDVVGQFRLGVEAVDRLEILGEFHRVLGTELATQGVHRHLLDAERDLRKIRVELEPMASCETRLIPPA